MARARHRLVTIGDSMTQGFMSGAIHRPELSYPAMLADALGVGGRFRLPDFGGQGGLPINIERIIRVLSTRYGEEVSFLETPAMLWLVSGLMDDTEDYWERGPGAGAQRAPGPHHNVGVWGFEVDDGRTLADAVCRAQIGTPRDDWFSQLPNASMYRTGRRVLNPQHETSANARAPTDVAQEIAADGGIENLIVYLGANNCLGTVTSLSIDYVPTEQLDLLRPQRHGNLYRAEDFALHYRRLADSIHAIGAARVFVATVPHVTIPPVVRGVSPGRTVQVNPRNGRTYWEYYTRPWVWDPDFDPERHPHLTRAEAMQIDTEVDAYNTIIRETAADRGWHVVDVCAVLDALSFRSHGGHPQYRWPTEAIEAFERNPDLRYLIHTHQGRKHVDLDTRFFHVVPTNGGLPQPYLVDEGGLFSLDGIHPTTIGYGIIAHEMRAAMQRAGVPDLAPLNWDRIIASDSLVAAPPSMMTHLRKTLRHMDRRGWLSKLLREF